jgi:hypothetical protein
MGIASLHPSYALGIYFCLRRRSGHGWTRCWLDPVANDPKRLCATNREQDHTHGSLIVIVILRAIERPMRRFILPIFLTATFSAPCVAQVQPGSVGGTIGKQDKSISGGEETDRPRAAPHPKRAAANSHETSSGGSCSRIVGTWSWGYGLSEMVFGQNGTVRQNVSGKKVNNGTWTCSGTVVTSVFATGDRDRIVLSNDGNSASVTTTWAGGLSFNVSRRGGD